MGGGPPSFTRSSTSSVLLWYISQRGLFLTPTGLSPALVRLSRLFDLKQAALKMPATPGRIPVWACPLSLAATYGIDVSLFSCRYLDVSVPCVRSTCPMRSDRSDGRLSRRVSAFRNFRINACVPAPRNLSQAAASFVASRCQDIHRTPLRVWPHLSTTVNHPRSISDPHRPPSVSQSYRPERKTSLQDLQRIALLPLKPKTLFERYRPGRPGRRTIRRSPQLQLLIQNSSSNKD